LPETILNRDLRPSDVPLTRTSALDGPGGGNSAEWIRVWRFAHTFDPVAYASGTGIDIDTAASIDRFERELARDRAVSGKCAELRAALHRLYAWTSEGMSVPPQAAELIDALLDAIYAEISGGKARPEASRPVNEPGLGVFGANYGSGQHRFSFTSREGLSREALFDRVAGILLREAEVHVIVSALYLYPPTYEIEGDDRAGNTFMLLLELRKSASRNVGLDSEYERLERLIVSQLADTSGEHYPSA
jgi:hypothetical protein